MLRFKYVPSAAAMPTPSSGRRSFPGSWSDGIDSSYVSGGAGGGEGSVDSVSITGRGMAYSSKTLPWSQSKRKVKLEQTAVLLQR